MEKKNNFTANIEFRQIYLYQDNLYLPRVTLKAKNKK